MQAGSTARHNFLLSLIGPGQEDLSSLGPRVYLPIVEINRSMISVLIWGGY